MEPAEVQSMQFASFIGFAIVIMVSAIILAVLISRIRQKKNSNRLRARNHTTEWNNKAAIPLRISENDETYVDLRIKKPHNDNDEGNTCWKTIYCHYLISN